MLLNVDFSTPTAKRVIVALASLSSAIFCALFYEVKKRIEKRGGNDTVRLVKEGKPTVITVVDHDLEALYELFSMGMLVRRSAPCLLCLTQRQAYFVATFARVYMGVSPPLLLQALTQPLNFWEHPVFRVYVLAADDSVPPYERPWASVSSIAQWDKVRPSTRPRSTLLSRAVFGGFPTEEKSLGGQSGKSGQGAGEEQGWKEG